MKLTIKERFLPFTDRTSALLAQDYYIVVKDENSINRVYEALNGNGDMGELSYFYGFDTDVSKEAQIDWPVY